MAFLPPAPVPSSRAALSLAPRMSSSGPQAPADFKPPTPRLARVRGDAFGRIAGGAVGLAVRGGTGALIAGYRVRSTAPREYSAALPAARPAQPLVLYAYPACPFCRKVFEGLCVLDLDVLVKPCVRDGKIYREYVSETFGKTQFPYLYDANTGFGGYESGEILEYLFKTYGGTADKVPLALSGFGTVTAGLAGLASGGRGRARAEKVVTAPEPLEIWGYEPSPFCKIVFERLCELEIPYMWHTTPRGSPTREALAERTGQRFQVPYLVDPNTGIEMFESADIVDYLNAVYGPDAPGAKEVPTDEEKATANALGVAAVDAKDVVASDVAEAKLDPPSSIGGDSKLEEYCSKSPDADECRTYDE